MRRGARITALLSLALIRNIQQKRRSKVQSFCRFEVLPSPQIALYCAFTVGQNRQSQLYTGVLRVSTHFYKKTEVMNIYFLLQSIE